MKIHIIIKKISVCLIINWSASIIYIDIQTSGLQRDRKNESICSFCVYLMFTERLNQPLKIHVIWIIAILLVWITNSNLIAWISPGNLCFGYAALSLMRCEIFPLILKVTNLFTLFSFWRFLLSTQGLNYWKSMFRNSLFSSQEHIH